VQVATGIAATEGSPEQPGALPAQAIDHGTGYLLAAAVLRALTEQSEQGYGRVVRLALARTAAWLTDGIERGETGPAGRGEAEPVQRQEAQEPAYDRPDAWLAERDSGIGRLRYALPPVSFAGGPADWARPPGRWGTDPARWA
jgi:crotonobetainyl-CoA:carnitine CoA-transferase CaiB-like acyl-CoA transferase